MAIISWEDSYNVGDTKVDEQHKKLFALFNTLYELVEKGATKEVGKRALVSLVNYTKIHFNDEIAFYEASGLPTLNEHIALHKSLYSDLAALCQRYDTLDNPAFEAEEWIRNQLLPHILGPDMEANALLNKGQYLKWDSSYDVGDKTIDQQHRKLFDLFNILYDCVERGADPEVGKQALSELLDYTDSHFTDEIAFYTASQLSTLSDHKQLHYDLHKELSLLYDDYYMLANPAADAEEWMKNRLLTHILEVDMKANEEIKGKQEL
uniref:Hemerythrin-like domain-containing protein n=1 Tax=Magnetococcus massalia (strain MO-1) TaxID=451514 RepID=A0A1S7LFS5_MAGMO|nr:conserved protein of unknown function [include 2 Hemerythrin HHE cation binding domain ] [Candidatus Magnetococcus massalia]